MRVNRIYLQGRSQSLQYQFLCWLREVVGEGRLSRQSSGLCSFPSKQWLWSRICVPMVKYEKERCLSSQWFGLCSFPVQCLWSRICVPMVKYEKEGRLSSQSSLGLCCFPSKQCLWSRIWGAGAPERSIIQIVFFSSGMFMVKNMYSNSQVYDLGIQSSFCLGFAL